MGAGLRVFLLLVVLAGGGLGRSLAGAGAWRDRLCEFFEGMPLDGSDLLCVSRFGAAFRLAAGSGRRSVANMQTKRDLAFLRGLCFLIFCMAMGSPLLGMVWRCQG